jgi:hypothetical protein
MQLIVLPAASLLLPAAAVLLSAVTDSKRLNAE